MKEFLSLALAAIVVAPATHASDPVKAYIDRGFAAMDFNKDGHVDHPEFERFMRARLQRQEVAFEAQFAKLDSDRDGMISLQEARQNLPLLAEHFAEVDTDHNGSITKDELRAAMLKAQLKEMGG